MGEIIDKCVSEGGCPCCKIDEERYGELISVLSQLHTKNSADPETLYKASTNNDFSGNYREIVSMQNELFTIACKYFLPWTEKYWEED